MNNYIESKLRIKVEIAIFKPEIWQMPLVSFANEAPDLAKFPMIRWTICFKLPFKLGCWLLLKISFFYSTNPNPTLEKVLHLNLFFCWLAARRWPYRGSPWQLDPYILIDFTLTENILLFQPLTYKLLKHIFQDF